MTPALIFIIVIFATVLALFLLWLFLIAPKRGKAAAPFCRPYAHRGLWSEAVPENSLAAFCLAAEAGFAIELDVQLSSDGEVMVFHDYTLTRMCGVEKKLVSLTAAELQQCSLKGTAEHIPTLRQVLEVVSGKVPLLVELKGEAANAALCPKVAAILDEYKGEWCVESFNPILVRWFYKNRPRVVRGLLSTNLIKEKRSGSRLLNFALSALWLTFLCRPHFHAFDKHYPRRLALLVGVRLFGAAPFVYTVKNEEEYRRFIADGISPIFDEFQPKV